MQTMAMATNGQLGIQETKEMVVALVSATSIVAASIRDHGFKQSIATDFLKEILTNKDFQSKLVLAYKGASLIPAELKNLDLGEVTELIATFIGQSKNVISGLLVAGSAGPSALESSDEKFGIEETKQALVALLEIAAHLAKAIRRHGVKGTAATEFLKEVLTDKEFQGRLLEGFKGSSCIQLEIKDLNYTEVTQLVTVFIIGSKDIVDALLLPSAATVDALSPVKG